MREVPNLLPKGFVPEISLRTAADTWFHLKTLLRRKNIVLYFLSDVNCARCRERLKALAHDYKEWQLIRTEVAAVAPESPDSLKRDVEQLRLPFPVLGDEERAAERSFTFDQLSHVRPPVAFIVDRFSTLYYQELNDKNDPWDEERELFKEVEFLESRCPECGVYG